MSIDLKQELRQAIKCHLQQEGIYNQIKSFIAASMYAKMLNQDQPDGFKPVELPCDDDTQSYVYNMIMFMKEFKLKRTLQVLMLEANIVIDEANSKAGSAVRGSPVRKPEAPADGPPRRV